MLQSPSLLSLLEQLPFLEFHIEKEGNLSSSPTVEFLFSEFLSPCKSGHLSSHRIQLAHFLRAAANHNRGLEQVEAPGTACAPKLEARMRLDFYHVIMRMK